jgi:tripartite-type tricarboxylate transporter receptor subunit TctC
MLGKFAAGFLIAALPVAGIAAESEKYPSKPVRFVVPYAPGGGSDITARAIGQKLGESLGQTFVVDSRPGASGLVGTDLVAKSPPDGYTLILADSAHTINNVIYRKPRYDPIGDFAPVTLVATTPLALMAHPSFQPSLKELIAMPKAQSEKIVLGTSGQAGGPHMIYLWIRTNTGLTLNEVTYKGGGPAMVDAIGGQIQLVFTSLAAGIPHMKAGRLKALGVTSPTRHAAMPDIPTFQEAGLKDIAMLLWYGILAPAGTPKHIVAVLDRETAKALQTPDVRERFAALALDAAPSGPEEFRKVLERELKIWRSVIAQSNEPLQ